MNMIWKNVVGVAAVALCLCVSSFAADMKRDDPGRAAQRIDSVRVTLDTAVQTAATSAAPAHPSRDRYLQRATLELQMASSDYEQGLYRGAQHHAERAERLVAKATAPRKEK